MNTQDLVEEIFFELLDNLGIKQSQLPKHYSLSKQFIGKLKNSTIIYDVSTKSIQMYDIVKSDNICKFDFDNNKLFLYYLLEKLNINLKNIINKNDKKIIIILKTELGPSIQYSSSYLAEFSTVKLRKFTISLDIDDFQLTIKGHGIQNNEHVNISNNTFCTGNSTNIIKQYYTLTNKYNFSFLSDLYYYQNEYSGYRSANNKKFPVQKLGTILNDWVRFMKKTKYKMEEEV